MPATTANNCQRLNLDTKLLHLLPSNLPTKTYPPLHNIAEAITDNKNFFGEILSNPAAIDVYARK